MRIFALLRDNSPIRRSGLIAAGFLFAFQPGPSAHAAAVVVGLSPAAFGQITPSQVIMPPSTSAHLSIQGDATADPFPSRLVIEFAITGIGGPNEIENAIFRANSFGGSAGGGPLKFSLFGYAGTGVVDLDSGIDPITGASGQLLAGPFFYNSVGGANPNLQNINVTSFIKSLAQAGATHAGFMFRAVDTPVGTRTISHFIVVQDSPNWAGDIPPSLSLTLVPEPSTSLLAIGTATLLLRRRRG